MLKIDIGTTAGYIWEYLHAKGETPIAELKKKLKLKDDALFLALGWLAREDKVFSSTKKMVYW